MSEKVSLLELISGNRVTGVIFSCNAVPDLIIQYLEGNLCHHRSQCQFDDTEKPTTTGERYVVIEFGLGLLSCRGSNYNMVDGRLSQRPRHPLLE